MCILEVLSKCSGVLQGKSNCISAATETDGVNMCAVSDIGSDNDLYFLHLHQSLMRHDIHLQTHF